jgi:hypothetical protein
VEEPPEQLADRQSGTCIHVRIVLR